MNKFSSSVLALLMFAPAVFAQTANQTPRSAVRAAPANKGFGFDRSKSALPQSQAIGAPIVQHDLHAVKPPRSSEFYAEGGKEAEYEGLLDQEIKKLYELSQQYRRSSNRGEIWLRLAERYIEKGRLVDIREQGVYDKKVKAYNDKKTRIKPVLNQTKSREYTVKAVDLYQWFLRDFPKDPKIDQALFFLGYSEFELNHPKDGEAFYQRLLAQFPNSVYISESNFALGEYYFDQEKWKPALDAYMKVISRKRSRLNLFAMYKAAWCMYRTNQIDNALKTLERVMRMSGGVDEAQKVEGGHSVNQLRLGSEALHDYVQFYAESGEYKHAQEDFQRVTQDDKRSQAMLERLAYAYFDNGNRQGATFLFKKLIGQDPTGPKAADYQYRVVLSLATGDAKTFRGELTTWLEQFGPGSAWAQTNAKNKKLIDDMSQLQEGVMRNYVLQLHQTAQNSRAPVAQQAANISYAIYFKHFASSPQSNEMAFFRAELLFDMGKFEDASKLYSYYADREPKGKYTERAIVNNLLALEKDLPSTADIDAKRGKSLDPIPFDPAVARFEKGANRYFVAFPKGDKTSDVLRRLGVLYYSYNQFDKAIDVFERILKQYPDTPNATIAGNLILDIYKLRGDMKGLAEKGNQLLQDPKIAHSKFGQDIRELLEKANYLRADSDAKSGNQLAAAKGFEAFASTYQSSDLALAARYKAAAAYEKAGDSLDAIRMHRLVLASAAKDPKIVAVQNDSRKDLARIYKFTGQLEAAAKAYEAIAQSLGMKDQNAINAYYNAAVLQDGLNEYATASRNYERYLDNSKKSDRYEVVWAQAELARRQNQMGRADALYEAYLKGPVNDKEHIAKATYNIAKRAMDMHHKTRYEEWSKKVISLNRRFKGQGSDVAAGYAAEMVFHDDQETMDELKRIRFTKNEKQQGTAVKQIEAVRAKYINQMKDVIKFDNAQWIIAALASTGQMFDTIAQKYKTITAPSGYAPDDVKKFQDFIAGKVKEMQNSAKDSYKAASDKALELESYGPWSKVAANGYAQYNGTGGDNEVSSEAKSADWMGL